MLKQHLEKLFGYYLHAFEQYDLNRVCACYHLPCTLNTPDKIVLLTEQAQCHQEFSDIFTQLKQAQTEKIIARNASYLPVNDDIILACVDWEFINRSGQVFADFCAVYHISVQYADSAKATIQELKILNVVSHELSNSISLTYPFSVAALSR